MPDKDSTNAARQAAWRARREDRIKTLEQQVAELQAENDKLRAQLERARKKPVAKTVQK